MESRYTITAAQGDWRTVLNMINPGKLFQNEDVH